MSTGNCKARCSPGKEAGLWVKNKGHMSIYLQGYKRCDTCVGYYQTKDIRCYCCNTKLRSVPRSGTKAFRRMKAKLEAEKKR